MAETMRAMRATGDGVEVIEIAVIFAIKPDVFH